MLRGMAEGGSDYDILIENVAIEYALKSSGYTLEEINSMSATGVYMRYLVISEIKEEQKRWHQLAH